MTTSIRWQRRSNARGQRSHHPYERTTTGGTTASSSIKSSIVGDKQPQKRPHVGSGSSSSSVAGLMMDGTHPHLWLTKDNINVNFRELLHSIRCRPSMTELSIYHIHSNFTKNEFAILYDTIARCLPQLHKFSLWTCQAYELNNLTNFLQKAPKLRTVSFQNVRLNHWKDTADFANAICRHPSLTNVSLDMLQITAPGLTLDPLLHAIARSPNIRTLRISTLAATTTTDQQQQEVYHGTDNEDDESMESTPGSEREMIVNSDCLVRLCNNGILQELVLCGVELNDTMVEQLADSLSKNRHLHALCLRNCGPYFTQRGTEAFIQMLRSNGTIQNLQLDCIVGESITNHQDLGVGGSSDDGLEEEEGRYDQRLLLPSDLQWWLDFYLYLNMTDTRRTLLFEDEKEDHSISTGDWLEAMEFHNHDLSATFHLLREHGLQLFHY